MLRLNFKSLLFPSVLLLLLSQCSHRTLAESPDLVQHVNTLQGTNSHFKVTRGNTFPATSLPFAMHMWTPQTGPNGDGWKYQYFKDTIRGFQQSHQCSSWTNDYCAFSLMPVVGDLVVDEHKRASKFSHDNETAKPHYYQVMLENGTNVEISPTMRGAILRFTFPEEGDAHLIFDGYTGRSEMKINAESQRVTGWVRNGRVPRELRSHYVMEFDQPILEHGTWRHGSEEIHHGVSEARGRKVGSFFKFKPGSTVQVKIASSYIDAEQAELNFKTEVGKHAALEEVRDEAQRTWNQLLNKVVMEGGSDEQFATFYSCLYRASLFPHSFHEFDADGKPRYRSPYDHKVHPGYLQTDTGYWDTFRGQFPLNTLLHPTMHGRYLASLLDVYDQCGWLPSWSFPHEGGSMIGNHAISLLTDGWVKGIRTFDPVKALEAYHHEATQKGPWGPANGRDGWQDYYKLGYVASPGCREATAKTLEYAYDDFCGYHLAKLTDQPEQEDFFAAQMSNYKNVFDSETGFMRARQADGEWVPNFDPIEWGGSYTEGCAWHWIWTVMHDVTGLIELFGSEEAFIAKLDAVFTETNEFHVGSYGFAIHEMNEMAMANMGQYAHGNQPIQHMPYLYCYAGQPWKTQHWVREIMDRLYSSGENGYPGDEDQGQTSAWYVLSAMGFYSVCPGVDEYVIGAPIFESTTVSLENGNQFVIEAPGVSSENRYIQAATLNDKPFTRNFLRHSEITNGGKLVFEMGPEPNRKRGILVEDRPYSVSTSQK